MAFRAALHRLPVRLKSSFLSSPSSSAAAVRRISRLPRHSPLVSGYRVSSIHSEATPAVSVAVKEDDSSLQSWKIKMLYDGECPLCMREVNMLKERNKHYGAIKFVDISSKDYSPKENEGLDYITVMGRIHAVLSDGTVLTDVDAFRRLYEEVGLGWIYVITKYEPMATIANSVYKIWAKYRLQITGRPPLEDILQARKKACIQKPEFGGRSSAELEPKSRIVEKNWEIAEPLKSQPNRREDLGDSRAARAEECSQQQIGDQDFERLRRFGNKKTRECFEVFRYEWFLPIVVIFFYNFQQGFFPFFAYICIAVL